MCTQFYQRFFSHTIIVCKNLDTFENIHATHVNTHTTERDADRESEGESAMKENFCHASFISYNFNEFHSSLKYIDRFIHWLLHPMPYRN